MKTNGNYIMEYKNIIQSTNLKKGYQEFIKFFRYLRAYLAKELKDYNFTSNIIENNMDYSYFQFTNQELKAKGLKIVVTFDHQKFIYEVWLSGINRKVQTAYYDKIKNQKRPYTLSDNPNNTDYIIKNKIIIKHNYNELEQLLKDFKDNIINFIENV